MSENQIDVMMKWNCSTIFLLHPLGLNRLSLSEIGFKEAYVKDEYCETEYKNPVFLLFEPKDLTRFEIFVNEEYKRENKFSKSYDLKDDYDRGNGQVVLVYEFPSKFNKDYERFLKGEYSKFSKQITETYPKMIEIGKSKKVPGVQYRIITKDRDTEAIVTQEYGQSYLINNPVITVSSMLEERFDTVFTEDMELWKRISIEKETLKI